MVRRSSVALTVAIVLCSLLVTASCQRGSGTEAQGTAVSVEIVAIEPDPPVIGPATLQLRLLDSRGMPITGLSTVEVEGTMSHAGMRPVIVTAREWSPGVYVTEGFTFTMGGDWIILVRGTWNGRRFEARTDIPAVRSATGSTGFRIGVAAL